MKKPVLDSTLKELSATLREKYGAHITDIILFGSRARGDFQEESDYDVLVLVDKRTTELRDCISEAAWELGLTHNVCISIVVQEIERFEKDKYEPLFMNIRKEGVRV